MKIEYKVSKEGYIKLLADKRSLGFAKLSKWERNALVIISTIAKTLSLFFLVHFPLLFLRYDIYLRQNSYRWSRFWSHSFQQDGESLMLLTVGVFVLILALFTDKNKRAKMKWRATIKFKEEGSGWQSLELIGEGIVKKDERGTTFYHYQAVEKIVDSDHLIYLYIKNNDYLENNNDIVIPKSAFSEAESKELFLKAIMERSNVDLFCQDSLAKGSRWKGVIGALIGVILGLSLQIVTALASGRGEYAIFLDASILSVWIGYGIAKGCYYFNDKLGKLGILISIIISSVLATIAAYISFLLRGQRMLLLDRGLDTSLSEVLQHIDEVLVSMPTMSRFLDLSILNGTICATIGVVVASKKEILLMKNIKLFFRKVMLALLALFIMVFVIPISREIRNESRLRQLDPWERRFEVIDFHRGNRHYNPRWDIASEYWGAWRVDVMDHSHLADPVGFENIRHKDVALEAGNEVLIQLQNEGEFINYVPTEVFYNTELNFWFIHHTYKVPRPSGGGRRSYWDIPSVVILIDGEDGSIVKVLFS